MALELKKGDNGFDINFTVTNSDGTAFNLTGYTIKWKMWPKNRPTRLILDVTVTIVSAVAGTCKYAAVAGDFDLPGLFDAELEMTQAGVKVSTKNFEVLVADSA